MAKVKVGDIIEIIDSSFGDIPSGFHSFPKGMVAEIVEVVEVPDISGSSIIAQEKSDKLNKKVQYILPHHFRIIKPVNLGIEPISEKSSDDRNKSLYGI